MASAAGPTDVPPPAGMRLAELLVVGDQTDEAGRLLLEDAAPKRARRKAFKAGVPMKPVRCPYQDTPSRYGSPMNLPAYEALRHDTAQVLDGFAWLATNYASRSQHPPFTVRSLFDVSYLALTIPLVLFFRAAEPIAQHGQLPTYVASLFKAGRGVFSASVDLLNRLGPGASVTGAEVLRFADAEGHLMRAETGRACAAPTRLIERTLTVALGGQGADPQASALGQLVDFDVLWPFYRLQDSFSQSLSGYRYHFAGALAGPGVTPPSSGPFAEATGALLRQANATQSGLNQLLGRGDDTPAIGFQELLQLL